MRFPVGAVLEAQNRIQNQFSFKVLYNYLSKKNSGVFQSINKKVKKMDLHCIFKMWFDQRRVYFLVKTNSEKAKHPRICPSFGGMMPEAQLRHAHLTP